MKTCRAHQPPNAHQPEIGASRSPSLPTETVRHLTVHKCVGRALLSASPSRVDGKGVARAKTIMCEFLIRRGCGWDEALNFILGRYTLFLLRRQHDHFSPERVVGWFSVCLSNRPHRPKLPDIVEVEILFALVQGSVHTRCLIGWE